MSEETKALSARERLELIQHDLANLEGEIHRKQNDICEMKVEIARLISKREAVVKELTPPALEIEWVPERAVGIDRGKWSSSANLPPGVTGVSFTRQIANLDECKEFYREMGVAPPQIDERVHTVRYYRVKIDDDDHRGVLVHCGGGTLALHDHAVVTDEEWEAMLIGDVPERLIRSGYLSRPPADAIF